VGEDIPISHPVLVDESGRASLGVVAGSINPPTVPQAAWTRIDSAWATTNALSEDYAECIVLLDEQGESYLADCQPLAPKLTSSQWKANDIIHSRHQLQLSPYLAAGEYQIMLRLQDSVGNLVGEPAPIGVLQLEALPRTFAQPMPSQAVQYRWEDAIALIGYDLDSQSDSNEQSNASSVTLYWQALRRMDTSYKFFLHVIDPSTGEPIAQIDYLPDNWSYPTNWWEADEYISDVVTIPLSELPPGSYEIRLGIYDPDSGERLNVTTADGTAVPNQSVRLTTFER
jgi:hypothetical protein